MSMLGDSDAISDEHRVLSQHQAAITLLQSALDNPKIVSYKWLDLGCGQGQILAQLQKNVNSKARKKVKYFGVDIAGPHANQAEIKAKGMNLACSFTIGEASDLGKHFQSESAFDFITCTNLVHEIPAPDFGTILIESLLRLAANGMLFVYDMENLAVPELGAVPLKTNEVTEIIETLMQGFGIEGYKPEPSQWNHKNVSGWSILIQRQFIEMENAKLVEEKPKCVELVRNKIQEIMQRRLIACEQALSIFTLRGVENEAERDTLHQSLYEFWAVRRMMGDSK